MKLADFIDKRQSTRSFMGVPVDEDTLSSIRDFFTQMKPLFPEIPVCFELVKKREVRCLLPWLAPQLVACFTPEGEGTLENAGFMLQQLELYLHALGLGVCWLGLARLDEREIAVERNGMKCVMLLTFGYPKGELYRTGIDDFNRKPAEEIADRPDPVLEPARLAPSSVNSQPWYFVHEGERIHAYCNRKGFLRHKTLGRMNRFDMGIALSHLYVSNPGTFYFERLSEPLPVKDYIYTGTIRL